MTGPAHRRGVATPLHDRIRAQRAADRLVANTRGWPLFMAGFLLFGGGAFALVRFATPWVGGGLAIVGVVAAATGIMIVARRSRCPHCRRLLMNSRHQLVDPVDCPQCGVTLR